MAGVRVTSDGGRMTPTPTPARHLCPAPAEPAQPAEPTGPAQPARPTLSDLLRMPPTVHAPYTPASLGTSVQGWATLLRDGDIVEVRPGFAVGPGTPITAELRALSLSLLVPAGVVVGRATAAWVHTGFGAHGRVCVLYAPGGHRPRDIARLEACQATVRPWEITVVPLTRPVHAVVGPPADAQQATGRAASGQVPTSLAVTSVVRTAMDVATWCAPDRSAPILDHLVAAGLDVDEALDSLDRVASWRGAETARTRLLAARRRARARAPVQARTTPPGLPS